MLFRSKHSQSVLDMLSHEVGRLKIGQQIKVSRSTLVEIGSYHHNGATFTPPDQVLENVMGSCAGWGYDLDLLHGHAIFWRREHREGDAPTYRSPDRRGSRYEQAWEQ